MDLTYTCIYGVFSRCKDAHFKHRIMTWNTHHEKDKNHGAKMLKFLKSCVMTRKLERRERQLTRLTSPASKLRRRQRQSHPTWKSRNSMMKNNTIKQLQSNKSRKTNHRKGQGKGQAHQNPKPFPSGGSKGNYNTIDSSQFGGEKATFQNADQWLDFVNGNNPRIKKNIVSTNGNSIKNKLGSGVPLVKEWDLIRWKIALEKRTRRKSLAMNHLIQLQSPFSSNWWHQ
ncbi:predicted protein [Chaetoceros tenuissimus]|uniref:Uncharacterized protein n=1 Tax=Chaetoceros tenuissimus TaxID=426638 RepID=A0AAD3DAU4_9STRA|nr:predicted protein [Chaetoceros tenuissimus]